MVSIKAIQLAIELTQEEALEYGANPADKSHLNALEPYIDTDTSTFSHRQDAACAAIPAIKRDPNESSTVKEVRLLLVTFYRHQPAHLLMNLFHKLHTLTPQARMEMMKSHRDIVYLARV
jgi:hypothetical protein